MKSCDSLNAQNASPKATKDGSKELNKDLNKGASNDYGPVAQRTPVNIKRQKMNIMSDANTPKDGSKDGTSNKTPMESKK